MQTNKGDKMNPLTELAALGQSIWYDNIQRTLLENGDLARMIAEDSLTGLTSNPTIFDKAISHSTDYDETLAQLLVDNPDMETIDLYEALAISDIQAAADLMRPVYDRTAARDGYVSLEVSPKLADDTEASIAEGRRLFKAVGRPNLCIKIPATPAGLPAITTLISEGINVNVTLMFSLQHYDDVAEAYISGLEQLDAGGGDLSRVASVASFFVSRVDTAFDKALTDNGTPEALALRGQVGIANAKAAYRRFEEVFGSDRFSALAAKGAGVQRPLWASTGTKNPDYSDVLYVENLIGPDTVNTMPPNTILAFKDHGKAETQLTKNVEDALAVMEQLKALGIDYDGLTRQLQADGVNAFIKSFEALIANLEGKRAKVQTIN
jgi:transaldolase